MRRFPDLLFDGDMQDKKPRQMPCFWHCIFSSIRGIDRTSYTKGVKTLRLRHKREIGKRIFLKNARYGITPEFYSRFITSRDP